MKYLYAPLLLIISSLTCFSQKTFYGVTQGGNGNIFRFDAVTNEAKSVFDFANEGTAPGQIAMASDGKIYGTTFHGGKYGYGGVYSVDPISRKFLLLTSFDHEFGQGGDQTELAEAPNGMFYGISPYRGVNTNDALLYSFDRITNEVSIVDSIKVNIGRADLGRFSVAKNGKLYATTETGIYAFDPSSKQISVVYRSEEEFPTNIRPNLFAASNGLLYGVKISFDLSYPATLFAFDPVNGIYKDVYNFSAAGREPFISSPMAEANGLLFGVSPGTGGILAFSMDKLTMTLVDTLKPGEQIAGINMMAKSTDGMCYGTAYGRDRFSSYLIRFNPNSFQHSILKKLPATQQSYGSVIQASDGSLHFLSQGDNVEKLSTFYQPTGEVSITHSFTARYGNNISGSLVEHPNGLLYGITTDGGAYNEGVLFSFNVATNTIKVIKNMRRLDGAYPRGGLSVASNGALYGVTEQGGLNNAGVLFSYRPDMHIYKVERHFDVGTGGYPRSGLASDKNGKFYGLTAGIQGSNGNYASFGSMMFSFDPVLSVFSTLPFKIRTYPTQATVTPSTNGKVYVLGFDSIYSFDPGSGLTQQFAINKSRVGQNPRGPLVEAPDGRLYATMEAGGSNNAGTIFRFNPPTNWISPVYEFAGTSVKPPFTNLTVGSDGLLYGESSTGGDNDLGTVFSFNPKSKQLLVRASLSYDIGWNPNDGGMIQLNNNILPRISIADRTVYESEQRAILAISLSKPSIYNIVVGYSTLSGTAKGSGTQPDYTTISGKLIFPAGTTKMYVTVPVIKDLLNESSEQFNMILRNLTPTRSASGDTIALVTILDGTSPLGANFIAQPEETNVISVLSAVVLNNPTTSEFQVKIQSPRPATLRILNALGTVMQSVNVPAGSNLVRFGSDYHAGLYIADIRDDRQRITLKLIKQ